MNTRRRALVVLHPTAKSDDLKLWLLSAGYDPTVSHDFLEAKRLLDADAPDLLVTEVQLGPYNGLHLVIRGRSRDPRLRAIVLGTADPVLQAEAAREQAIYLTHPLQQSEVLRAVSQAIDETRPGRRTPRKHIAPLQAFVDETEAVIRDVSYEGLRVETQAATEGQLPRSFVLKIPSRQLALSARWVWMASVGVPSAGGVLYGIKLAPLNPTVSAVWRALVDSSPGPVVINK